MKLLAVFMTLVSLSAMAERVDVKGVDGDQDTTISIKKGATDNQYEVVSSEDEVLGDAAPLLKDARANWKRACDDWKKENKELSKDNLISISCGKMECSTVAMESTCRSMGTYKTRVKVK